jgi:hypothetical protein
MLTIGIVLVVGDILKFTLGDEFVVWFWHRLTNALSKAEADLLVYDAHNECLLRMDINAIEIADPDMTLVHRFKLAFEDTHHSDHFHLNSKLLR